MPVELASKDLLRRRCEALPLFPLPGVVFIPHTLLPLHVFEPRYRVLIDDVVRSDRLLAVPLLGPGWQSCYEDRPPLHPVAGIGQLVRHQPLQDGRSNIVLVGLGRARILGENLDSPAPYRVVRAELFEDRPPQGGEAALRRAVTQLRVAVGQLIQARPTVAEQLSTLLAPERTPEELADTLAHLALREPEARQEYLELPDIVSRLELVLATLAGILHQDEAPLA